MNSKIIEQIKSKISTCSWGFKEPAHSIPNCENFIKAVKSKIKIINEAIGKTQEFSLTDSPGDNIIDVAKKIKISKMASKTSVSNGVLNKINNRDLYFMVLIYNKTNEDDRKKIDKPDDFLHRIATIYGIIEAYVKARITKHFIKTNIKYNRLELVMDLEKSNSGLISVFNSCYKYFKLLYKFLVENSVWKIVFSDEYKLYSTGLCKLKESNIRNIEEFKSLFKSLFGNCYDEIFKGKRFEESLIEYPDELCVELGKAYAMNNTARIEEIFNEEKARVWETIFSNEDTLYSIGLYKLKESNIRNIKEFKSLIESIFGNNCYKQIFKGQRFEESLTEYPDELCVELGKAYIMNDTARIEEIFNEEKGYFDDTISCIRKSFPSSYIGRWYSGLLKRFASEDYNYYGYEFLDDVEEFSKYINANIGLIRFLFSFNKSASFKQENLKCSPVRGIVAQHESDNYIFPFTEELSESYDHYTWEEKLQDCIKRYKYFFGVAAEAKFDYKLYRELSRKVIKTRNLYENGCSTFNTLDDDC